MKTKKLYENAYLRAFTAQVCDCVPQGDVWQVVLDATCFFPEGGGQAPDRGVLGGAEVLDVQERDGVIYHTVSAKLIGEVRGEIDWETRFKRMQSHTGEHLVSGLAHTLFGCNNVGFHMSEDDTVTFDFDKPLSPEQTALLEESVNRAIYENRAVTVEILDSPKGRQYRSKLELQADVRLVTIDGYDCCACCAPHVRSTGEIGLVKFLDVTPHKGGVRITAVCGESAYRAVKAMCEDVRALMKILSAPRSGVVDAVERCMNELDALKATVSRLEREVALATIEVVHVGDIACGFLKEAGFDTLRECANTLPDSVVALFAESGEYVLRGEGVNELTKSLNTAFSGKGGGKPGYTQGKLTARKDEILKFMESVV